MSENTPISCYVENGKVHLRFGTGSLVMDPVSAIAISHMLQHRAMDADPAAAAHSIEAAKRLVKNGDALSEATGASVR